MNWIVQSVVISVTFLVLVRAVNWWQDRKPRVPVERLADPAPLPGEQLPRAGRLPYPGGAGGSSQFTGAGDPCQQLAPVPWDLASAAYTLGQQATARDEITRQVDAIMLEVELDPRWGYR